LEVKTLNITLEQCQLNTLELLVISLCNQSSTTTPLRKEALTEPPEPEDSTLPKPQLAKKLNVLLENISDGKVKREISTLLLKWLNFGHTWMSSMKDLLMLLKVKI
jgi:hypothetical protein